MNAMIEMSKSQSKEIACMVVAEIVEYISSHKEEYELFLLEEVQHEQ